MNKWNATLKYLCTHLNYSVILMYSATPPTQTSKGNKKLQKLNVVYFLFILFIFIFILISNNAINSHFHTFRLFYKSFFTSLVYLSYMYFIFMNVNMFSYVLTI